MRTVGRMAWNFALTNVLTRSRGTPAAAFARYCRRKVLVAISGVSSMVHDQKAEGKGFAPLPSFGVERGFMRRLRLFAGERRPRPARDPQVLVGSARQGR